VLVHVLDCTASDTSGDPSRNPVADFDVIEAELDAYQDVTGSDLQDRPRLVVLNKIDVPAAREVAEQAEPVLAARGLTVLQVSAATREGIRELAFALAAVVAGIRAAAPVEEPTRRVIRPQPAAGPEFVIEPAGENTFLVRGAKPWRWVQQTDFANEEAVGYLADRLAKLGVEEALAGAGAEDGAEVMIGNGQEAVVFDWDPDIPMGHQGGRGPRGTDRRLAP
jgi:GTP-binding protein